MSYLRILLICILSCLLFSCVSGRTRGLCRHKAIYCAIVYGDLHHVPVRIAYGPSTYKPNSYHCQAQAYINGEWKWLTQVGDSVVIGEQDYWFTPTQYFDVYTAMAFWIRVSPYNPSLHNLK